MQFLNKITSTENKRPGVRAVICGQEKMGKTTLVCGAPDVLLIPMEAGFSGVTVQHVPMITSYADLLTLLNEIITTCQSDQWPFRTIAFDSVTAMERLIHESVLQLDSSFKKGSSKTVSMESALGGYGKAYGIANERFGEIIGILDILAVQYQINIILTCHVFASKMVDPQVGEYDSWDILLHSPKNQKTYGKREFLTQWADLVGFLYEPLFVSETHNVVKGISQNKGRVLGVSRTPGYVAGNRFGMEGEIQIPRVDGWNHLAHAIYTVSGIDIYKR